MTAGTVSHPAAFPVFPAETRYILDAIAAQHGGPPPRPAPGIDWQRMLEAVRHHRVAPLMGGILDDADCPDGIRTALAELRRQAVGQSISLAAELVRLIRTFRAAKIDVLALKGTALSVMLYGDPCRRAGRDIDLLVRSGDVAAATALLHRLGYENSSRIGMQIDKDLELRHPGLGCIIELHTGLDECEGMLPLSLLNPFDTAVMVTVGGERIPTLAPDVALVFAAFHGAHHFWRRLFWLADIAAAAHNRTTDWPAAFALARRVGVEGHLAMGTVLAHELLGAPLPELLAEAPHRLAAARRASARLHPLLTGPLLKEETEAIRRMGRFRWLAWELGLCNRMANRLALLRYRIRPSLIDRRLVRLPSRFGFLYYGVRMGRIFIESLTGRFTRPGSEAHSADHVSVAGPVPKIIEDDAPEA